MRIFIDTEFHEYKKKGTNTIELISIALVKDNGDSLYLISNEFDQRNAWNDTWLKDNVLINLPLDEKKITTRNALTRFVNKEGISIVKMKEVIREFVGDDEPEFWGYYCDYDWVVFCWIFGRIIDLPINFPMYCNDLIQDVDSFGVGKFAVKEISNKYNTHNALGDALFNKNLWEYINNDC